MACVALACLMSTIKLEFLQPIPRVPLHDQTPIIQSFFEKISSLQAFLVKSSGGGGAKVRDLEIEIRDFALKAEDAIEIQLSKFLLAKDTECEEDKASRDLQQTLREAAEKAAELVFRNEVEDEATESIQWSVQDFELDRLSLCHPPRLDNKMVGRDNDYETIKNQLVDQIDDLDENETMNYHFCQKEKAKLSKVKLIWIVGMPGIGKTTLATSLYEDPIMKKNFEVQVWITTPTQKYNLREILCNLLLSIGAATEKPTEEIIKRSTPSELADQVHKCLIGTRFLIVLHNFWNSQAWDDIIKPCFLDNQNGSRILLTTTHFRRDSYATSSYYIHNMTLLDSRNSWDSYATSSS